MYVASTLQLDMPLKKLAAVAATSIAMTAEIKSPVVISSFVSALGTLAGGIVGMNLEAQCLGVSAISQVISSLANDDKVDDHCAFVTTGIFSTMIKIQVNEIVKKRAESICP